MFDWCLDPAVGLRRPAASAPAAALASPVQLGVLQTTARLPPLPLPGELGGQRRGPTRYRRKLRPELLVPTAGWSVALGVQCPALPEPGLHVPKPAGQEAAQPGLPPLHCLVRVPRSAQPTSLQRRSLHHTRCLLQYRLLNQARNVAWNSVSRLWLCSGSRPVPITSNWRWPAQLGLALARRGAERSVCSPVQRYCGERHRTPVPQHYGIYGLCLYEILQKLPTLSSRGPGQHQPRPAATPPAHPG